MVMAWERVMSDQTAAIARVDVPAHVDPALVVDFDFFADHRYAEAGSPHGGLLKLAEDIGRGIFWTPRNGGHWFITDHELLFEAARMPELFSSRNASFPAAPGEEPFYPPVNSDPPDHSRYRLPLMRAFAPGRIRDLEQNIRAFAIELIEAVKDRGRCDFVDMVAEPLPIFIFMKLMGFDTARYREFREWAVAMSQPDVEIRGQAYIDTMKMARPLFDERRAERKEDVLSFLLDEEVDGRPFDQAELDGMCIELFGAGLDTVVNSLAFTIEHLARDPALQDRLRAEPALIPEAVEEVLRRYSVALPARSVRSGIMPLTGCAASQKNWKVWRCTRSSRASSDSAAAPFFEARRAGADRLVIPSGLGGGAGGRSRRRRGWPVAAAGRSRSGARR